MTTDQHDSDAAPKTPAAGATLPANAPTDASIPPPPEMVAPEVGPLRDLDVREAGTDAYVWTGIDRDGRRVSGVLRRRLVACDAGAGVVQGWEIELDEKATE